MFYFCLNHLCYHCREDKVGVNDSITYIHTVYCTNLDGGNVEVLIEADRSSVSSRDIVQFCRHILQVLLKQFHLEQEHRCTDTETQTSEWFLVNLHVNKHYINV